MTTPDTSVRAATEDDAARLAEIHVAAWRATYRGVMTDQYLDGLDVGRAASVWRRNILEPREGTKHLVVQSGHEVTGFAILGPGHQLLQQPSLVPRRSDPGGRQIRSSRVREPAQPDPPSGEVTGSFRRGRLRQRSGHESGTTVSPGCCSADNDRMAFCLKYRGRRFTTAALMGALLLLAPISGCSSSAVLLHICRTSSGGGRRCGGHRRAVQH